MYRKVFVLNGVINLSGKGRLATLEDLEENLCLGVKPIEGTLQLADGIYKWISSHQQKEILKNDEDTEAWELEECEGEYVKANNNVPKLYEEFISDVDNFELLESCTFDEGDNMLVAVTRVANTDTLYIYNYSKKRNKKNENKIVKNNVIAYKSMFSIF